MSDLENQVTEADLHDEDVVEEAHDPKNAEDASVASVKGTDFWLLSNPETGDQVMGLEGTIGLTNNETGQEVDVTQGMSGVSTPDGNLGLEETIESALPEDPSEELEGSSEIKIYLEGPNGQQKVMIIEYQ